jgi:hypothetical protein
MLASFPAAGVPNPQPRGVIARVPTIAPTKTMIDHQRQRDFIPGG